MNRRSLVFIVFFLIPFMYCNGNAQNIEKPVLSSLDILRLNAETRKFPWSRLIQFQGKNQLVDKQFLLGLANCVAQNVGTYSLAYSYRLGGAPFGGGEAKWDFWVLSGERNVFLFGYLSNPSEITDLHEYVLSHFKILPSDTPETLVGKKKREDEYLKFVGLACCDTFLIRLGPSRLWKNFPKMDIAIEKTESGIASAISIKTQGKNASERIVLPLDSPWREKVLRAIGNPFAMPDIPLFTTSLIAIDWTLSMQSDQEAREKITQAVRQSAITADELVGGGIHLVSGDKINTIPLAQFLQGDFKVAAPPQPMLTLDAFEACLGIQGNGKKMGQVVFISRNADVTIRVEDREEVPTSLKACLPKLPVKFVQLQGASVPALKALLGGNYCLLNGDLLNWLLSEI